MLFAGYEYDRATGLYYLNARYYDPVTAQFLSVDPLASLTLSFYDYVGGRYSTQRDPSGAAIPIVAVAAVGIVRWLAAKQIQKTVASTVAGASIGATLRLSDYENGNSNFANPALAAGVGAIEGGVSGACIGLGLTALGATVACSAVGSVMANAFEDLFSGSMRSSESYAVGAGMSGFTAFAGDTIWKRIAGNRAGWVGSLLGLVANNFFSRPLGNISRSGFASREAKC